MPPFPFLSPAVAAAAAAAACLQPFMKPSGNSPPCTCHKERGCCLVVAEKDGECAAVSVHHRPLGCCSIPISRAEILLAPPTSLLHPFGQQIFVLDCARGGLALWPAVGTQMTISFLFQQWAGWEHATCWTWLTGLHQASRKVLQSPCQRGVVSIHPGSFQKRITVVLTKLQHIPQWPDYKYKVTTAKAGSGMNSSQLVSISVGRTALLSTKPIEKSYFTIKEIQPYKHKPFLRSGRLQPWLQSWLQLQGAQNSLETQGFLVWLQNKKHSSIL